MLESCNQSRTVSDLLGQYGSAGEHREHWREDSCRLVGCSVCDADFFFFKHNPNEKIVMKRLLCRSHKAENKELPKNLKTNPFVKGSVAKSGRWKIGTSCL